MQHRVQVRPQSMEIGDLVSPESCHDNFCPYLPSVTNRASRFSSLKTWNISSISPQVFCQKNRIEPVHNTSLRHLDLRYWYNGVLTGILSFLWAHRPKHFSSEHAPPPFPARSGTRQTVITTTPGRPQFSHHNYSVQDILIDQPLSRPPHASLRGAGNRAPALEPNRFGTLKKRTAFAAHPVNRQSVRPQHLDNACIELQ